ncbi:tetratricopeptide (TPR) repeat protein [Parabacteroides sp. PF5-5]|uniref:tetratricopeptide repeat protein n=1 Tax=unclassified Parabacteroides TaxID=2649774 RepID=UPI002472F18F|nr:MULTISPECIES: tetratricopeptide repeat protein [unclassified Parabacteroides]MDH6306073.1 tetratricopeptide (TPR) repeat protein [Parabacteroides sp. PH5-39]MDH6317029.1 tetratricopeptide (TPR) repeat protein [Parabacteroides sp. PF5-13]MDH6320782.1 tetratricopeptide (TPR) repeat protein [Parabacteroides sp. PH5-13]MDH6324516.1 tetratricopeptide (TPR) repeat protein [Parabacteroides sp. PH5-8]MDH6328214.1 tetratricopeptide (TPR) repeat protein [Parabacteroides sp. PH5-41]
MTIEQINKAYNRTIGSLDNKELKSAFDTLQALIAGSDDYTFQEKLNELQETYQYMLRYRMEGVKDPMQESIYLNLQASTYELSDQIKHKLLAVESSHIFYNRRRSLQVLPKSSYTDLYKRLSTYSETNNDVEYETTLSLLFNKIWVSDPLTPEESLAIKQILDDTLLPFTAGCQIVSALFLGMQTAFDKEKLLLLFDAASVSAEKEVRVRALISVLLSLYIYKKRTPLYPQIENRLATAAEEPGFTNAILTITLRFILARETEKISRKLQDEIIPEMIKLSPKISKKINLSDFSPEHLGDEMNPDWQDLFADSALGKKMEEFGELQQEGADIMHSTFVHLKNFPFFRELSNWFLPFTPDHSSFGGKFKQENSEKEVLEIMTDASFMCNSDKYSLYFSMMQLPEAARKMMAGQFNSQAAEMIQQKKEDLVSKRIKFEAIAGQYVQDLYRFYKLYPSRLDFDDIFSLPLDFHNLPIFQPYISDQESLTTIAEYYLRKHYFEDALVIFNHLSNLNKESDILFQKIGYCKQMTGDMDGALDAYLYADLLNPDSKWTIRRIAGCYRSLKQLEEALEYYRRYEELSPDDLSVQISIGHCHLELKNYTEALKYYFKVEYLDTKSHKAWRPIAWCSFLTGKYDQARNYYHKILTNQPNMQDFLNAGHTEWALQNIKGAIDYYKQAIQQEDNDFQKFREQFIQDIPDLVIAGIEESEVPLILDQLRYILS